MMIYMKEIDSRLSLKKITSQINAIPFVLLNEKVTLNKGCEVSQDCNHHNKENIINCACNKHCLEIELILTPFLFQLPNSQCK